MNEVASVGAVFAAGLLSVFSPCVMPLMPAYLSLISGVSVEEMQEAVEHEPRMRRRVLLACLGFVAGFSTVFIVLGASATANNLGVSPMVIGLTIVGFGTSAPEMLVSGVAAWTGGWTSDSP